MSLINQMLRDLEARRSDDLDRQKLQREIRALPLPPPERSNVHYLALGLGLALAASGGWYWYAEYEAKPAAPPPAPVAVAAVAPPQAAPAPSPLPPIQAMLPAESETLPEPPPEEQKPAAKPSSMPAADPHAPPKQPKPAPRPPPEKTGKPAEVPVPAAKSPPPAKAVVAEKEKTPAATGQIEKTPSAATPRERADIEYRKAVGLTAAGRGGDAIETLQSALRLEAGHQQARQALAKLLLESRRGDEASAVLREGLDLQPAQIGWAMALARLQVERGDYAAGAKTLGRSLPHAGRSADFQGFYGYVQQHLGQHHEAVGLYQAALQLAPTEGRWWLGLGIALEGDGQAQEAREAFRRALATGNLGADLAAVAEQRSH